MKEYEFRINPMGKPRMTQRDKWKKRPCVVRYRALKDYLNLRANILGFELSPVLHCTFVIPMPKSWSKKKKLELNGKPHQSRPDIDNLEKAVMDALAKEDSFIHTTRCNKIWGETGKIIFYDKD